MAQKECPNCSNEETNKTMDEKLKESLMRYWTMARTSSPQFVVGRLATCTASGALSLLSAATLAEAMGRFYLRPGSFEFCKGESDYKWSIKLILLIQVVAVGVGSVPPAMRWFLAMNLRCPTRGQKIGWRKDYKVEGYWIKKSLVMKEWPLNIPIRNPCCRRVVHDAKVKFLNLCINVQTGIVLMSKVIVLISVSFICVILLCYDHFVNMLMKLRPNDSITNESESGSESRHSSKLDLRGYVLCLEGEDSLVDIMMKENRDAIDYWWQKAKKRQPKHLIKLLELSRPSQGFKGLEEFDSSEVPCLDAEEAPNCYALAVVTLTSIAIALPNISSSTIKHLIAGVNEGLMYVRHIEEMQEKLVNMRKAAEVVWLETELYYRWLDVDLQKLSHQARTPKEILQLLSDLAKKTFIEFKKRCMDLFPILGNPSKWSIKVLAANSMYRVSQSFLLDYECRNYKMSERLLEAITLMISDIFAACLTNLQRFVAIKCLRSSIEEREKSARFAAYVLGKTEKILKLIPQNPLPGLNKDQMAFMDDWRSFHKQNSTLSDIPISPQCESTSPIHSEVHLTVN